LAQELSKAVAQRSIIPKQPFEPGRFAHGVHATNVV
jgi:hypothetical protein